MTRSAAVVPGAVVRSHAEALYVIPRLVCDTVLTESFSTDVSGPADVFVT
jgi:hypothetical protein